MALDARARSMLEISHQLLMLCYRHDPRDVAAVAKEFAVYIEHLAAQSEGDGSDG